MELKRVRKFLVHGVNNLANENILIKLGVI